MLPENMELIDEIRFQQMKYMGIYHLIGRIYSSQKKHQFIRLLHIRHRKHQQTYWYRLTTERLVYQLQYLGVQITMAHITSLRS